MPVCNLIEYFENLNADMESKREHLTRKETTKSLPEKRSSKMKQFISEITELKRPTSKNKTTDEGSSQKSSTLPKNFKNEKSEVNLKNDSTSKASSRKKERDYKLTSSLQRNKYKSMYETEYYYSEIQNICEQAQQIEQDVEEFAKTLKEKRLKKQNKQNEITLSPSSSNPEYLEDVENNGEINVVNDNSNFQNRQDEADILPFLGNPQQVKEEVEQSTRNYCNAENDDGDMFGFNNFDENEDDNYVLEAYNRIGYEFVMTKLSITRHTITHNEIDENIAKLINNSDYVFHKSEYENSDLQNKTNSSGETTPSQAISDSENLPLLLSNYSSDITQLDDSVFDDVVREPYMNKFVNYDCSTQEEVFYENISSFSVYPQEIANVQVAHSLGEIIASENVFYENMSNFSVYPEVAILQVNHSSSEAIDSENNFYDSISNFSICPEAETNVQADQIDDSPNEIIPSNINTDKRKKIEFVIEEMIKTEELYISGLAKVMKQYVPYLYDNTPQNLIGWTVYLFGNIEHIYKNAKKFLKLMKDNCDDPDSLAQIFINSDVYFNLYPLYSKNKPKADEYLKKFDTIVKDRQTQLDDKLGLASYLLTPIQRLGKYVLLLEQIQKELKKDNKSLEKISRAIGVVRNAMRKGNDYIAIDSIKNSAINLTDKGSFIMRALFNIFKPKKFLSMVFLFENVIVFTEKSPKLYSEEFKYVDSIPMSDLSLGKCEDKPNTFDLTNYAKLKKSHPEATYVLEAETSKMKNEWTDRIEKILWIQLEKVKEQQKKMSVTDQKHRTPTPSTSDVRLRQSKTKNRTAKKSKSKFYYA